MLKFEIRINDGLVVSGQAVRKEPMIGHPQEDIWYNYDYRVTERDKGEEIVEEDTKTGRVYHRYADGASRLVQRILEDHWRRKTTPERHPYLFIP